jgi:hypothetical protein
VSNTRRALLTAKLEALEVARGDDGWLRGHPEPVILLGAGVVGRDGPILESRTIARFATPSVIPVTALPADHVRLTADHRGPRSTFFLIALALEHDGGDDIAQLYGAIEAPARWSFLPLRAEVPEPLEITEACARLGPAPSRVEPMLDGAHLALENDEIVGATFVAAATHESRRGTVRLHFVSANGKNDWTARVGVTVRAQR